MEYISFILKTFPNISYRGEQISLENIARSKYKQRWGTVLVPDFYSNDRVNDKIHEEFKKDSRAVSPYVFTGHGESYFVSKDMYKSYMATCRCGRDKCGTHLVNCLKACTDDRLKASGGKTIDIKLPPLPPLSSQMVGLPHNYLTWERSTYYVSPKCFVAKPAKVGLRLFDNIILG